LILSPERGEGFAMIIGTPSGHDAIVVFQKIQGKLTVRLPDLE
jgi:hypothetical protein